ncbi:MAG: HIT domain-containing protein [Candidatus Omnitrophica bacterium]|nr:HIT domain-containing protein [Candidatus Omnitrophota bacterium]
MDRLWAPWRKAYIRPEGKKKQGCVFCSMIRGRAKSSDHILLKTSHSFAVLNLYPYNNGHTLILPRRHVQTIGQLRDEERLDWLETYVRVEKALHLALKPHGLNVGINLGRSSGAGIPGHLHLHAVPRWTGDVNFMPVVAGTKVISESMESVYRLMKRALAKAE